MLFNRIRQVDQHGAITRNHSSFHVTLYKSSYRTLNKFKSYIYIFFFRRMLILRWVSQSKSVCLYVCLSVTLDYIHLYLRILCIKFRTYNINIGFAGILAFHNYQTFKRSNKCIINVHKKV